MAAGRQPLGVFQYAALCVAPSDAEIAARLHRMSNQMAPICQLSGHRVLICYTRRFRQPPCAALNASRWRLIRHRLPGCRHKSFRYSNPYNGLCAAPKGTKTAASLLKMPAQMVPSTGRPGGCTRKFWNVNPYNGPMCGLKCRRDAIQMPVQIASRC